MNKKCNYPHLQKCGGGCPYAKSCGCPPEGSLSKSEFDLRLNYIENAPLGDPLVKAKPQPPAGYQPVPNSKKGGYRKRSGKGYVYWYPDGGGKGGGGSRDYREEIGEYNLQIVAGADGQLSKDDIQRAKDIAQKMREGIAASADVCKLSPPVCTGNLGIPRRQMPQILEAPVGDMLNAMGAGEYNRLKEKLDAAGGMRSFKDVVPSGKQDAFEARMKALAAIEAGADPNAKKSPFDQLLDSVKKEGVSISKDEVPVGQLKATQKDIKAGKTYGMADAYLKGKFKPQDAEILISSDNHILDGHHRYASLVTADPGVKMKVTRVDMPMKEFLKRSFEQPGVFRADLQGDIVDPKTPHDLSGSSTKKSLYAWGVANPQAAREVLAKAQRTGVIPSRSPDPLDLVKSTEGPPVPTSGAFRYGSVLYEDRGPATAPAGGDVPRRSLSKAQRPDTAIFVGVDQPEPHRRGARLINPLSRVWAQED